MYEDGQYLFNCPHCGGEISTPDEIRVQYGASFPMMCSLCKEALVFVYLPRERDFIRSFALDTEIMTDEDFSPEEVWQYVRHETVKYLDESGFTDEYFRAIERAAEDFGSDDSMLDFANEELGPIPEGIEDAIHGLLRVPGDSELGI